MSRSYRWVLLTGSLILRTVQVCRTQGVPMTTTESRPTAEPSTQQPVEETARQARHVGEAAREKEWRKPSFGKALFLGRLRLNLIDPWPQPSPELQAKGKVFLDRVEEFARTKIDNAQIERDARLPDEVVTGLADLGAFGMKIDEK